jgi:protocatechuate 3,4-dioxygenase beta subunit
MSHRLSLQLALSFSAIVVLAMSSVHAQQTDKEVQPSGSISGQVTLRGKPVAGIPVAAIAGNTTNRRDSAARSLTDGQGYYRIGGLPPGEYQVWTLTPGLIAEQEVNPGYSPYGSIKSILLSPNEDVGNIDLKLATGAVITGRVTTTDNQPVVEERVLLELLDERGNPRFGLPQRYDDIYRTDDRGIYRVFGLPPGRYKISVGLDPQDAFRGSPYPRTYYSDQNDPGKPAIVDLKEGDEANHIDMKVGRPTSMFAVSGRIVDATTGRPVSGVRFKISVDQKERGIASFGGLPTDASGEFRFEGLRPGHYTAAATSEFDGGGNYYGDPVQFEITDHDVTGIELKAVVGLTLSGVVAAEGFTTKELLTLLPDLRINASSTSTTSVGRGSTGVAADGTFQISGLRPGRVVIDVYSRSGNPTGRPTVARIEHEGVDLGQRFELQQSLSGIVVAVSYGTGTIRGTVTFTGGQMPPNASIYVTVKRETSPNPNGIRPDARGNFVVHNLTPGTYEVVVNVGIPNEPRQPRQPPKQSVNVTNGAVSEVNFLVDLSPTQPGP